MRCVKFGRECLVLKMGEKLLQVFLNKMADATGYKMAAWRAALNSHEGSAPVGLWHFAFVSNTGQLFTSTRT